MSSLAASPLRSNAPAIHSTHGSSWPMRNSVRPARYPPGSRAMTTLTGGGTVSARRCESTQPMSTRPIRPLPSPKGWIDSNCAWTTEAWVTGSRYSSLAKDTRSSMRPPISSGGGGTNAASRGEVPPTQDCSVR